MAVSRICYIAGENECFLLALLASLNLTVYYCGVVCSLVYLTAVNTLNRALYNLEITAASWLASAKETIRQESKSYCKRKVKVNMCIHSFC